MAKSEQYVDWQSTKNTVLERSRHMFNNPFMSDIMFSCEGSDKKFFAHKYVLGTSSAVFYAMFYGELAEKNTVVHLRDTSEEILKEFLRFLYTDQCNLTTDNAMFVLCLAKKYIVPSLAEKCIDFLEAHFTPENVFVILKQARQFDEEKLVKKCWDFVDLRASDVVASDYFVNISQSTLEELLKRESLKVKEVDLFNRVLKWSEAECLRKEIEINPNNKRAVMGNTIDQIRFAAMTLQEFGQNVSQSGILTPDENVLIYKKFSELEKASEVRNWSEIRGKEKILRRCSRFKNYRGPMAHGSKKDTWEDALAISFTMPVKIHGVSFLGASGNAYIGMEGEKYDVKLEILSQIIEKKFYSQQLDNHLYGFDVILLSPVTVQAGSLVYLKATVKGYTSSCTVTVDKEQLMNESIEENGITVNFFDFSCPGSTAVKKRLQIHEIIFSQI